MGPTNRRSSRSPSGAGGSLLEIRGISKSFATRKGAESPALGVIDVSIAPGEFVAIVGPSGCGKTTLLRIVGGLEAPTAGQVIYQGRPVEGPVDDLGIVFQRPVLLEWRTVLRNVVLQADMRNLGTRTERARWARELLDRVGLTGFEDRYPWELSGGQQQRVSLCRALIHQPALLLMDEPFGALDALTREELQRDLEDVWSTYRPTVLFVTHDVVEAVSLADRVLVLAGRPGDIAAEIEIDVPRPRAGNVLESGDLQRYAREVRAVLGPLRSAGQPSPSLEPA